MSTATQVTSDSTAQDDLINIHKGHFDSDFTRLPNTLIRSAILSWNAKSLLSYLLSLPDDWVVHTWQLAKVYQGEKKGNGRDAIRSMMLELREKGYVIYTKFKNSKGEWAHQYKVYAIPGQQFKILNPGTDHTRMGDPAVGDPAILEKTELPTTKSTKKELIIAEGQDSPEEEAELRALLDETLAEDNQVPVQALPITEDTAIPTVPAGGNNNSLLSSNNFNTDNKVDNSTGHSNTTKKPVFQRESPERKVARPQTVPKDTRNDNIHYRSLNSFIDLSDNQKRRFNKYPESTVDQAVKFVNHRGGLEDMPIDRVCLMHDFCKYPENYEDYMKNIGALTNKPLSNKNILLTIFEVGKMYNGMEFCDDKTGTYFIPPSGPPIVIDFKRPDFPERLKSLLKYLHIEPNETLLRYFKFA